ncbi:MAG: DUF5606 domain-containing protein [Bacteroidota bacterium]|nr:DUF5606 domain-containing protein [Bacteroidota bacterium]
MNLKGILAISGYQGLFKMISQAKNAIIVESLIDKKRMPAYTTSKISSLEDIAIFTSDEDLPLLKVFQKIYEHLNKGEAISHKSSGNELKKFFTEILPEYDKERVYVSDIKKVIQWYNLLLSEEMIDLEEDEKDIEENAEGEVKTDDQPKEKSQEEEEAKDSEEKPDEKSE